MKKIVATYDLGHISVGLSRNQLDDVKHKINMALCGHENCNLS